LQEKIGPAQFSRLPFFGYTDEQAKYIKRWKPLPGNMYIL